MADPIVNTSNVFIVNESGVTRAANAGSFDSNTAIRLDAMPRVRVGTTEVLADEPSAVVAGIEKGAESAARTFPSVASAAGRIAPGASIVGGVNDTINVGQHVIQGNGAEAATEGMGVAGQAGGAALGAKLGAAGFGSLFAPSAPAGALIGGTVGAWIGAKGLKEIGTYLTGGDTPDKLGPPITLGGSTQLPPAVIDADGNRYSLAEVNGKRTWFSTTDNINLPRYVEVVSGVKVAELTNTYLKGSNYEAQLAQAKAEVAEQQRQGLQDAFTRSEIEYRNQSEAVSTNVLNGKAPDGSAIGKLQRFDDGSSLTWTRDPATGDLIRIATSGGGDGLVVVEQHYDGQSGAPTGGIIYQGNGKGGFDTTPFGAMVPRADAGDTGQTGPATGLPADAPAAAADTVFNPATALASYTGNNAVTIQNGDTVGSIAARYGMGTQEFIDYLKEQYGPGADLNSIVAGNKLPIPPETYERSLGGINGLDLPPEQTDLRAVRQDEDDVQATHQYDSTDHSAATANDSTATDEDGQQTSQTHTTTDSDGSKTITTSHPDGRVDRRLEGADGSLVIEWQNSDGAYGSELYRQGLIPSADYLARVNLAVDIGNNSPTSNSAATNYVDYYFNNGLPSATDPQRLQHVEITGVENGQVSVIFSGRVCCTRVRPHSRGMTA